MNPPDSTSPPRPDHPSAADLPLGFHWAAAAAGIRYAERNDLALVVADQPAVAAAVFTRNRFQAAPVLYSRDTLKQSGGRVRGVLTNAGCANAATGELGLSNARTMAEMASRAAASFVSAGPNDTATAFLVCSTGTIGVQLPMPKIEAALPATVARLQSTPEAFSDFARAILTTDTVEKIAMASYRAGEKTVRVIGCAKGSGMMRPDMATMLAYVFTDVQADPADLQSLLSETVETTLNCVTVDGDTSTNDTTILLASGASGAAIDSGSEARSLFAEALRSVLASLARQLARDGEGATKLVHVIVRGADDYASARTAAFAIANSPLVKTAIYGRDANWGRIACALGYSGVVFNPDHVTIRLGPLTLFAGGAPLPLDEAAAMDVLSRDEVVIDADLGQAGGAEAVVWTCDLTERYIEINGSYRT